jgi:hypothetical protein
MASQFGGALLSASQLEVADLCSRVVTALITSVVISANFIGSALLPPVSR